MLPISLSPQRKINIKHFRNNNNHECLVKSLKEKRDPICVGEKLGLIVNGQLDKASSINNYESLEIYSWAIIIRLFKLLKFR